MIQRSLKSSAIWGDVVVGLISFVAYLTMFMISKPLIIHTTDLKGFVLGAVHSRSAGQFLPGASGDFSRSLGISENPVSLLFDIPWLLATSVPPSWLSPMFGVTTCISLYAVTVSLGRKCSVAPSLRRIAGFLLPLVMFIPSPIQWNSVAIYTASFGWTVSTLTFAGIVLMSIARSSPSRAFVAGLVNGCFVFLANVNYLPMTAPVMLLICGIALLAYREFAIRRNVLVYMLGTGVPAVLILPLFLGTYLFGVWSIPETAVSENVDKLTSGFGLISSLSLFPKLTSAISDFTGLPANMVDLALIGLLLTSLYRARKQGLKRISQAGALGLLALWTYSIIYHLIAWLGQREVGLDPSYLVVVAYPIWILALTTIAPSRWILSRQGHGWLTIVTPVLLVSIWTGQWVIRNYDIRLQPAEYPILTSATTRQLQERIAIDLQAGSYARVIVIQNQFPADRSGDGFEIRRASDFSYTFTTELTSVGVPVLNAYSHMISPKTFLRTNQLFTDGRPTWRQFSLYDSVNIEGFHELSIKYVLSQFEIVSPHLTLLSNDSVLLYGLFPSTDRAWLYEVSPRIPSNTSTVVYRFDRDRLLITDESPTASVIRIPLEFSHCLTLKNLTATSNGTLERTSDGLIQITHPGNLQAELRYSNSVFQLRNCRLRDYFDFRRTHPDLQAERQG